MKSAVTQHADDVEPPPADRHAARRLRYPPSPPALLTMDMIIWFYLPVEESTIKRMVSAGEFPPHDMAKGAKLRFWRRDTVERWIDEQTRKGVA